MPPDRPDHSGLRLVAFTIMTVAAFVLGVVATVLATASLSWQVVTFLRRRPRPKLTPIVGRLTPEGLVTNDASSDVRECLLDAAEQLEDGPLIVGVKVVNAGRAPFHVAGWAIRNGRDGTSLIPLEKPIGGSDAPRDIAPGGSAAFLTELRQAQRFAEAADHLDGQPPRITLAVSSGARTYVSKPVASTVFSLGSDDL